MRTLLFLLLLLLQPGLAAPVATFEGGTEVTRTETFTVNGPWRLNWGLEGTALKVFVHHADTSQAVGKPISQAMSGSGSMDFGKAGPYYLEVKSVGHYKLTVEELGGGASTLPVFTGGTERKGTAIFDAPEGWGYRVTGTGTVLEVTLYDANRNEVGEPVQLVGSGTVTRSVGKAGKYFFMIKSAGTYRVEVYKK